MNDEPNTPETAGARATLVPDATPPVDDIRDIRGPVAFPTSGALLALVLAAALALLAYVLWRRRGRTDDAAPGPTPDTIALAALEQARRWMTPGQAERFGTAVSSAIRSYVEGRFEVDAPRRTTEEFLHGLADAPPPALEPYVDRLEELLRRMDLVKFARAPLDEPEMEGLLAGAREFVERTRAASEGTAP